MTENEKQQTELQAEYDRLLAQLREVEQKLSAANHAVWMEQGGKDV